jgi:hypothetical protein
MKDLGDQRHLLLKCLDGASSEVERIQVNHLLHGDSEARSFVREIAEQAVAIADLERQECVSREAASGLGRGRAEAADVADRPWVCHHVAWASVAIAAAACLLLWVGLRPRVDPAQRGVAIISGANGALQWTGDGGRVTRGLGVGARLEGGTIEGLEPFSWAELRFEDGTKVSISGMTTLTYSDVGRKVLDLRKGVITADVRPQPPGKPLTLRTSAALLEVLGTRFGVESGSAATMVDVRQGRVLVKRLSDGASETVGAHEQLIAAPDREFRPRPSPQSIDRWSSHLELGPDRTLGRWESGQGGGVPTLGATPYTTTPGMTVQVACFIVARCDGPAVVIKPSTTIRFRGKVSSAQPLWFGLTLRHPDGEFAGRFQYRLPADAVRPGLAFDVKLSLSDLKPDPSLPDTGERLPRGLHGLTVESAWCHSLDRQAGLQLLEAAIFADGQ